MHNPMAYTSSIHRPIHLLPVEDTAGITITATWHKRIFIFYPYPGKGAPYMSLFLIISAKVDLLSTKTCLLF